MAISLASGKIRPRKARRRGEWFIDLRKEREVLPLSSFGGVRKAELAVPKQLNKRPQAKGLSWEEREAGIVVVVFVTHK